MEFHEHLLLPRRRTALKIFVTAVGCDVVEHNLVHNGSSQAPMISPLTKKTTLLFYISFEFKLKIRTNNNLKCVMTTTLDCVE